jgi:RNA polymerase sigma-70 factor (ECF subfamily)
MNSSNEHDLIAGAKSFDLNTLGIIYDRYNPGIYRYAMRLLGDEILAEDCVADTFSRFLKALRSGQGPLDHVQAYLYKIAHNWITDSYRRHPPIPLSLDDSILADDQQQPENQAAIRMEQQRVRLALQSLTADQRQVVVLRFFEGWENDEVAISLDKPVGAIRALQFRALVTLRGILQLEEKEVFYGFKE